MNKQEIKQQATNTARIEAIKEDIDFIRTQVSNHLPHQISALDKRMDNIEVKLGQITIQVSAIITIVSLAIKFFLD